MRLNKYISQSGYCSRRQADELIKSGKVFVNNRICQELGTKIDPQVDQIRIKNGPELQLSSKRIILMLNKPKNYVCTKKDKFAQRTVYDLLPAEYQNLFSVGRLDKDTEGLLLFTNDGEFANQLTHPRYQKEKIYQATIKGRLSEKDIQRLEKGIRLIKFKALPAEISEISYNLQKGTSVVEITISEGKKRQIHEMFLALKKPVKNLLRTKFGSFKLGKLKSGMWKLENSKK